jgi:riboflavin synthase
MFTGLIEHVGVVRWLKPTPSGARLALDLGPLADGTRPGDSLAVDGCCLTFASLSGSIAEADVVPETLRRTTLGELRPGARVNLERALLPSSRLGGHFVQGHVDGTAVLKERISQAASAECWFALEDLSFAPLVVGKGSIALDGVSLTVASVEEPGLFRVALIPETLARTTLAAKSPGARVNVETDVLGKYLQALLAQQGLPAAPPRVARLTEAWLREQGY